MTFEQAQEIIDIDAHILVETDKGEILEEDILNSTMQYTTFKKYRNREVTSISATYIEKTPLVVVTLKSEYKRRG